MLHIEEQSKLEKADALELIDINNKRKKLRVIRRYTSHYLLGLKVRRSGIVLGVMLHPFARPWWAIP